MVYTFTCTISVSPEFWFSFIVPSRWINCCLGCIFHFCCIFCWMSLNVASSGISSAKQSMCVVCLGVRLRWSGINLTLFKVRPRRSGVGTAAFLSSIIITICRQRCFVGRLKYASWAGDLTLVSRIYVRRLRKSGLGKCCFCRQVITHSRYSIHCSLTALRRKTTIPD